MKGIMRVCVVHMGNVYVESIIDYFDKKYERDTGKVYA